jgi:hypothetical protein
MPLNSHLVGIVKTISYELDEALTVLSKFSFLEKIQKIEFNYSASYNLAEVLMFS